MNIPGSPEEAKITADRERLRQFFVDTLKDQIESLRQRLNQLVLAIDQLDEPELMRVLGELNRTREERREQN